MGVFGIVIQARIWAKRFPGKVLADLGGETVLEHVIRRCKRAHDNVIVATPDIALLPIAAKYGAHAYLGSETNVLARYVHCAEASRLDYVMRVTADCPFIDSGVMRDLMSVYGSGGFDYVSNVLERSYPYGLDCEICSTNVLKSILSERDLEPKYKEHVTLYIREHLDQFRTVNLKTNRDYTEYDWRLDSPEDLPGLRELYKCAGNTLTDYRELVSVYNRLQYGRPEHLRVSSQHGGATERNPTAHGDAPDGAENAPNQQGRFWYERGYRDPASGEKSTAGSLRAD